LRLERQGLTECNSGTSQEEWDVNIDCRIDHDLGQLDVREGQEQEDKAARRNVVKCGHWIELDSTFLYKEQCNTAIKLEAITVK
jgi:hypothetical protein